MPQHFGDSVVDTNAKNDEKGEVGDTQSTEEQAESVHETESPSKTPCHHVSYDAMRCEPLLTNVLVELYDGEKDVQGFFQGYGTAYFQGGNIYKGYFERGMMHGKGKFVWQDRTIYDGDFVNNHLEGSCMYIWPDDSVYNGEVKNGLRHGQGTFKCALSPCVYTGTWSYGKRHGHGTMKYDSDGISFYEGEWYDNQRHGWGTRRYTSGNIYEGKWKNNMHHGNGTMDWHTSNQRYSGQWYKGVQQGFGEHTWFLKRVKGSQYPLRNCYIGNFVNGQRHGHGVFYYASGAKYEGEWQNNMKHGTGMFVFKNGMIFKGIFDNDHMLEYPNINPSGMITPDITLTGLPVQRPVTPASSVPSAEIANTLDLNITYLFEERDIDIDQRQLELQQVNNIMLQHISQLKKIYVYYSSIGVEKSMDNTSVMSQMQFCRFLKDSCIHHIRSSLPDILRLIAGDHDPYYPWQHILMRDFLTALVIIANHMFAEEHNHESQAILPQCLSKLILDYVLVHTCNVGGVLYTMPRVTTEMSQYFDKAYAMYQDWLSHIKKSWPNSECVNMRFMLLILKDYGIIGDCVSAKDFIDICAFDDPNVLQDEFINLEVEISFLEIFEALVRCAELYVTESMLRESPTIGSIDVESSQAHSTKSHHSNPSAGCLESPTNESHTVSTHSALNVIEEKPEDDYEKPEDPDAEMPTKDMEIPLLSITASSTEESKQLLIDEHIEIAEPDENIPGGELQDVIDNETVQPEVGKIDEGTKELENTQDSFNVWCLKMSIFFKRILFPAAQRYKMLDKIVQDNMQ